MDPRTKEDYERLYHERATVTGLFLETAQHFPCPFCAAPEFAVARILEVEHVMQQEHICRECGRGCRAIIQREGPNIRFEFVQTRGPDPAPYLPTMRRVLA